MPRSALFSLFSLLASPISPLLAQRTLTATREFTISAEKQNLSRIDLMWVSAKGVVAIPQAQDNLIRFFDAKGTALGTFGRGGEGPGEFRDPDGPGGWCGDTVWVWDQEVDRVTYISSNLKLLRTHPAPASLLSPVNRPEVVPSFVGNVFIRGVFPDGSLRLETHIQTAPKWLPVNAPAMIYSQTTLDGHFIRISNSFPMGSRADDCNSMSGFCSRLFIETGEGSALTIALPEAGTANLLHYRVISVGDRADSAFNRVLDFKPIPLSTHARDSVQAKLNSILSRPNLDAQMRTRLQNVSFPASFPPLIDVKRGTDGSVWLEERTASTTTHHWRVLDAKGISIGTFDIPLRLKIFAVTRDTFWGIDTNADGLQDVVRYRVK